MALIIAELAEVALVCIAAVGTLIVSTLPRVWGPYSLHLLSILAGPIMPQQYKADCRLLSPFGPQSSPYRR